MPDADLEQVANAFIGAAYGAASQRCMAISTIMPVGKDTADRLVEILKEKSLILRSDLIQTLIQISALLFLNNQKKQYLPQLIEEKQKELQ